MLKYVKKGYMEMGEQLYLEPWKSAPGRSILHYSVTPLICCISYICKTPKPWFKNQYLKKKTEKKERDLN